MNRQLKIRRRLDDVDYWRKQAGWFDDDATMKQYNSRVYGTNDNGGTGGKIGTTGNSSNRSSENNNSTKGITGTVLVLLFILSIVLVRAMQRRVVAIEESRDKAPSKTSRTRSLSRSRSMTRKRSSKKSGGDDNDYKLMADSDGSKQSKRGKHKSHRTSSRGRTRSRSKSRSRRDKGADDPPIPTILV